MSQVWTSDEFQIVARGVQKIEASPTVFVVDLARCAQRRQDRLERAHRRSLGAQRVSRTKPGKAGDDS